MTQYTLSAHIREHKGKQSVKNMRRKNQIPAIFYGPKANPKMLSIEYSEFNKLMRQTAGENIIIGLQIASNGENDSKTVMLKELQVDPITDTYLHADFYEISMDKELTIDIPIHLVNTPKGVSDGGILQHTRREITISCLPDKLVDFIEVDVSDLGIGDSIQLGNIPLPEGLKATQDPSLPIAVVFAPTISTEKESIEREGEEEAGKVPEAESKPA
ncbi:MAG: 50S ribosomal protein L25 [Deltaproteobacteria bacterium]|nr:50S ribosomal protein L25 [Deltaproteobacteria bacterium]